MTATVLTNCQIFAGGFDFTGSASSLSISADTDDQDVTVFGTNGWKALTGGLKNTEAKADIFWESDTAGNSGAIDPEIFSNLGVANIPATFAASSTAQDRAFMMRGGYFSHSVLGDVGDLSATNLEIQGSSTQGLIRGRLAKPKGTVTSTGATGSGVQIGPGGAGKWLYATWHVFTAGTTISVKVESDNTSGFSTPVDVAGATIGPITTRGGTWGFVGSTRIDATSITDDWFRFNVTACTGSFVVAGALALQ